MLNIKIEKEKLILNTEENYFTYLHQYLLILKEETLKITLIGTIKNENTCEFYMQKEFKVYIIKNLEKFKMKLIINIRPKLIFNPIMLPNSA